jgi:ribosome-binding protein aMBF1 (putative translation factor)
MNWSVEFLDDVVLSALNAFPRDIRASFERIVGLIEARGIERMREPYVKHLEGRVGDADAGSRRHCPCRLRHRQWAACRGGTCLCQKDGEGAAPGHRNSPGSGTGGSVTQKSVPAEEAFKAWRKDPDYVAAYDALEEEFELASALIRARSDADMTQEQVASAMGTTQAFVARLESGRVLPSTRTLKRYAKATRTRLRISFEPEKSPPVTQADRGA